LSITAVPAAAARGACRRDTDAPGGKKSDVDTGEVVVGKIFHGQRLAPELDETARRAFARQRDEFPDRKFSLVENRQNRFADGTGGADHRDLQVFLAHLTVDSAFG
jgi:hypothetical protein